MWVGVSQKGGSVSQVSQVTHFSCTPTPPKRHEQKQTKPTNAPAAAKDVRQGPSEVGAAKAIEPQHVGQGGQHAVLGEGREVLDQPDGLADGVGVWMVGWRWVWLWVIGV